jgi:SP family facilitated glucose transporter-like MFS transporter 8
MQVFADELAHPKYRGFILSFSYIFVTTGIMAMSSLGAFLDWRTASASAALPSIINVILLYFLHESPTWFVRRYRMAEAERALQWLWGPGNEEQVSDCIYGQGN